MAGNRMKVIYRHAVITACFLVVSAFVLPSAAFAHLVSTGMGPVYDGAVHLLMTPEDLIVVIAIAVYAGLQGKEYGRYTLFLLPIFWFLGGLFGFLLEMETSFPLTSISFLLIGILIAADVGLPTQVFFPIVAALGAMHGVLNGQALEAGPGTLGLVGIGCTIFVLVALLSGFMLLLKRPWERIVIRVLGSWITASGMLMLGWYAKDLR